MCGLTKETVLAVAESRHPHIVHTALPQKTAKSSASHMADCRVVLFAWCKPGGVLRLAASPVRLLSFPPFLCEIVVI